MQVLLLEGRSSEAGPEKPGVSNPALSQSAATFRRTLDIRDGHPAETGSTGDSGLRLLSLADRTDRLFVLSSKLF